jgi:plastocyanin
MSILGKRVPGAALIALAAFVVCGGALVPVLTSSGTRDVVLVARDMAFHAGADGTANPVIEVRAGERVRVVLMNQDRGMTHDFAVPQLGAVMDGVRWNERAEITFTAPDAPGSYEYVCRPHLAMMKGTLRVVR